MRLALDGGSLEIEGAELGDDEGHGGDRRIRVAVELRGFAAETVAWVAAEAWDELLRDLAIVEEIRQGAASLEAISPEELGLSFRSTDHAGHMAVGGFVGVRGSAFAAKLTFTPVAFDPTELPRVLRELRALAR